MAGNTESMKRIVWVFICILVLSVMGTSLLDQAERPSGNATLPEGFALATVHRVVDGDTLVVIMDDEEYRVRLILVDTPESVHPDETRNSEYGKLTSEFTTQQLPVGSIIYLQKDISETDRYSRLLRYAWTDIPFDYESEAEVREKMYNAKLLLEGYAQLATFPPDIKYVDMFTEFQREAREANKGLWAYAEEPAPVTEDDVTMATGFVGNKNSKVLHRADCASVSNMSEANKVVLVDYQEGLSLGYRPCNSCDPAA